MAKKVIAIIPAAGLGKRFDSTGRKTFADISGTPLLVHTLKKINREKSVHEIIPVLREDDFDYGYDLARSFNLHKISRIAPGGNERQDSIYNALTLIEKEPSVSTDDITVLVHDGARPIFPEGTIDKLLAQLDKVDGSAPGLKPRDTLKEVSAEEIIQSTVDREIIRAIQTPQAFLFKVLKKAYDIAYRDGYYGTDDASLVERMGGRVRIIEGSPFNIKITTPEDAAMVEHILSKELVTS
jgi:2-C-methyl-D-erythritol 4-phosphate cytidylyltransferase